MTEVFFKLRSVKSVKNTGNSSNLKSYDPQLAIIVKEEGLLTAPERSGIFTPYNESTKSHQGPFKKRPEITPLSMSRISGVKASFLNSKFQSSASPNTQNTGKFSYLKSNCSNGFAPTETSFEAKRQENIGADAVQESLPRFNLLQKIADDINSADDPRTSTSSVVYAKPRIQKADLAVETKRKHIELAGNDHYFPRGYGQALDSNSSPKSGLKSIITTSVRTNQSALAKLGVRASNYSPSKFQESEVSTAKLDDKYHQIKVYNRNKNSSSHLARATTSVMSAKNRLHAKRPDTSASLYYGGRVELLNHISSPSHDQIFPKENISHNNLSITRTGKRDKKAAAAAGSQELVEDSGRLSIKLYPSTHTESLNILSKSDRKAFTIREIKKGTGSQNVNSTSSLRKSPRGFESKQATKRSQKSQHDNKKPAPIMRRISNQEIDALLMEMDSDFKEEVLKKWQVSLDQKSVKKGDLEIGNQVIAEDCDQTKKEVHNLIQHVNILMEHRARKLQEQKPDFLAEGTNTLGEIALRIIKQEYKKKKEDEYSVNYQKIADLTSQLTFFARLADHVKLDILRNATLVSYPANTTIFKQGDVGDLMYIILKGSVHVRIKKKTTYGSVENLIVNTLYDGLHFGDYAIINRGKGAQENTEQKQSTPEPEPKSPSRGLGRLATMALGDPNYTFKEGAKGGYRRQESPIDSPKSPVDQGTGRTDPPDVAGPSRRYFKDNIKRTATVETVEQCDLLAIPREKFQNIFMDMVHEDLHDKLEVLTSLTFLSKFDPFGLIPLANNLTAKEYKIGEIIQAADDKVSTFRIILRGRCKVILGVLRENNLDPPTTLHGRMTSVRPMKGGHGNWDYGVDYSCAETAIKSEALQAINLKKEKGGNIKRNYEPRIFNYDEIGTHGKSFYYVEHVILASLAPCDHFGGRSLLKEEDFLHQEDPFEKMNELDRIAKVSVIADSATVEVLEIEKDRLRYIPDALVKILKSGLINCKEFDDYNIEEEIKKNQKWRDYREKEVTDVYNNRIMPYGSTFKKF